MSTSESSSEDETNIVERVSRQRRQQRVTRDTDSDDENDLARRGAGNKAVRRHRGRAKRHSSDDSDDDTSSGSDSDSKNVMKKRNPDARNGIARARRSHAERGRKVKKLAKHKKKTKGNERTTDLAFEIDPDDMEKMSKHTVLTLEERTDFFKMQGSGLGLDDGAPLLSVNDFGLSVETVVQEAQLENAATRGPSASSARARKAWVYVENMATGRFKRVHMGRLGYSRLADRDSDEAMDEVSLTGPDLMDNATHSITALVAGVFQFAQGLLAGLALLHLFLVTSITAFGTFTAVYQPLSNESRRLYFILASLGLSSAIETFLRERENTELWNTLSPMQKIRILMCCMFYLITCGFSLAMMPTDALISTNPSAVSSDGLAAWNTFEYIR